MVNVLGIVRAGANRKNNSTSLAKYIRRMQSNTNISCVFLQKIQIYEPFCSGAAL